MTLLILTAVLILWTLIRLALAVRRDGLGERRPPASHQDWTEHADPAWQDTRPARRSRPSRHT